MALLGNLVAVERVFRRLDLPSFLPELRGHAMSQGEATEKTGVLPFRRMPGNDRVVQIPQPGLLPFALAQPGFPIRYDL